MQFFLLPIVLDILTVVVGLLYFKSLSFAYRLLWMHLILTTIAEMIGAYLSMEKKENVWFYNFFGILPELLLVSTAGMLLITGLFRKFVPYLIVIGLLIWTINIYTKGLHLFANWAFLYTCFLVIVIYMNVLLSLIFNRSNLLNEPSFWLSVSLLLYFSCALPYFGLYNYLAIKSPQMLRALFTINSVLNVIRYPLLGVSFYLMHKLISKKNTTAV